MPDLNTNSNNKLEEISLKVDKLIELTLALGQRPIQIEDWITEIEAQKLLGLKSTSMWSLRKQRLVKYSKIGGKTYYNIESIKELLEKNQE